MAFMSLDHQPPNACRFASQTTQCITGTELKYDVEASLYHTPVGNRSVVDMSGLLCQLVQRWPIGDTSSWFACIIFVDI